MFSKQVLRLPPPLPRRWPQQLRRLLGALGDVHVEQTPKCKTYAAAAAARSWRRPCLWEFSRGHPLDNFRTFRTFQTFSIVFRRFQAFLNGFRCVVELGVIST